MTIQKANTHPCYNEYHNFHSAGFQIEDQIPLHLNIT